MNRETITRGCDINKGLQPLVIAPLPHPGCNPSFKRECIENSLYDVDRVCGNLFLGVKKDLKAYHITWVTHGSRVSERMVEYKEVIRKRRLNKGLSPFVEPIEMDENMEVEVTKYISQIVKEDRLRVLAYNICKNHVHMVLVCKEQKRDNIVRKLKGKSTQMYKNNHSIKNEFHLWAQKYSWIYIKNEKQLNNTVQYVQFNREKHNLPRNKDLQPLVASMLTRYEDAFKPTTI